MSNVAVKENLDELPEKFKNMTLEEAKAWLVSEIERAEKSKKWYTQAQIKEMYGLS